MKRIILHSDMNSCYAGIEIMYNPSLRGKAMAVCGRQEERHGIVLAATREAKGCGVKTGEAIWQARQKCPELVIVEPHYDRYLKVSRLSREIYGEYTDLVEPFGLDECFLDVSGCIKLRDDGGETLANEIRERIKRELGVTVSVGAADNKIFAKLGSDMKKPDAVTVITQDNFREKVWPLPASDLLMVGASSARKLAQIGVKTIGELAHCPVKVLVSLMGKWGEMLWLFANGMDTSPVMRAGDERVIKSIGNSATMPRDVENMQDAVILMTALSESVAKRLRQQGLEGGEIAISVRDTDLNYFERQRPLERPTDISTELCSAALSLLKDSYDWDKPIRSLGVRAGKLQQAGGEVQLSVFADETRRDKSRKLESAMDEIRRRFGPDSISRAVVMTDSSMRWSDGVIVRATPPGRFMA